MSKEYDYEEDFHSQDRKAWRKERKRIQSADRSKYKKTDQIKKEILPIDPSWKKARVIEITKEGVVVDLEGESFLSSLRGSLKKERDSFKNLVAVGDIVFLDKHLAIIHIDHRFSFLARTDVTGKKEQLIAVNVDQAIITVSVVSPPLKPALVDRYMIAAEKGNIQPVILINKIDLLKEAEPSERQRYEDFLSVYEKLGFVILSVSSHEKTGLDSLRSLLKDKTSVFAGQSGVGKSSLLNATFSLDLKTGDLAHKTEKGTHTTTTARLLPISGGGFCVDTPGIRSFSLFKLTKEQITAHFTDLAKFECKYPNCLHIKEPECGVLQMLEEGKLEPLRYESYISLINEAMGEADHWEKKAGKA